MLLILFKGRLTIMDLLTAEVGVVFRAVTAGDRDLIEQAMNNYKEPGYTYHRYQLFCKTDSNGRNLLHYACMYNTDEVATWMLSLIDDRYGYPIPKISDKLGVTAVMYAARAGMVTFVKEWVKQENDIKTVDKHGMNILDYCLGSGVMCPKLNGTAWNPNKEKTDDIKQVVKILIDSGVCYSAFEEKGMTPSEYIDKYLFFIDFDMDIPMKIRKQIYKCVIQGSKPREILCGRTHLCVTVCFMDDTDIDNNQKTAKLEKMILNGRLDLDEIDKRGMTALHHLCYYKYDLDETYGLRECFVAKLLELGSDPNIKDIIRGYTPLMCALEKGYVVLYDQGDPRRANVQGLGRLLNAYYDIRQSDVDILVHKKMSNIIKGIKMTDEFKRQEELNENVMKEINELKDSNEELKNVMKEINELKDSNEELKKIKNELHNKLEENSKSLQDVENQVNDLVQTVKEQQQEINSLRSQLQDSDPKPDMNDDPTSSLLIGNVTLPDACRHLETDVEVICLPDASLEDLQAAISKDNQKYKNIYLVTCIKGSESDKERNQQYQELLVAAKNKCKEVVVSSLLPTLEDDDINEMIKQLNTLLKGLCEEAGCVFVDNDRNFKYQDGTIIEACFDEEEEHLSEFGIKTLLKNIGLLTAKKKPKASNMTNTCI